MRTIEVVSILLVLANSLLAQQDSFYLISSDDGALYILETNSQAKLVGGVQPGSDLYGLIDVGDALITIDRVSNELIFIDKATAEVVGEIQLDSDVFITRRGIAIDHVGTIYGIFDGNQLKTVDPLTGTTSLVANISGAARVEALTFGLDGTLFAAGSAANDINSENIYTLDISTGNLSLLGPTGFADMDALTTNQAGVLFGVDSNDGAEAELYQISPTTGAAISLGFTGVTAANGISFITPVLLGDVNLDGSVDLIDVAPFVELLSTGNFQAEADINQDGVVDLLDVGPFVNLLSGG